MKIKHDISEIPNYSTSDKPIQYVVNSQGEGTFEECMAFTKLAERVQELEKRAKTLDELHKGAFKKAVKEIRKNYELRKALEAVKNFSPVGHSHATMLQAIHKIVTDALPPAEGKEVCNQHGKWQYQDGDDYFCSLCDKKIKEAIENE